MKKFIKRCLIVALVFVIVGLILLLIGKYVPGVNISETVHKVTGGRINMNVDNWDDFNISVEDVNVLNSESKVNYDLDEVMMFDKKYPILQGDFEKHMVSEVVADISIEAGGCSFTVQDSMDENIYVEGKNTGKFQAYTEDGKLYVRTTTGSKIWNQLEGSEITLYLPCDYSYSDVSIELGAGILQMERLTAEEIDLDLGAGQIVGDDVKAGKLKGSVGAGEMKLNNIDVSELSLEVGLGNIEVKGNVTEKADLDCSMGNLNLDLDGKKEDFNFDIEGAMGNLKIGNESYSGLADSRRIHNDADKKIKVSCAMGNVTIQFTE